LGEAISRFNLSSPCGLRAYSESWIKKFCGEEARGRFRPIAAQTVAAHKAGQHPEHFSTTDSVDDSDGTRGCDYGSDAPDRFQNPVPIDPPGYYGVTSQFARNSTRAPWNGRWWQVTRNKRVYGPLQDGRAVEAAEWRRLLQLGRRAYALELVERDRRRPKHVDIETPQARKESDSCQPFTKLLQIRSQDGHCSPLQPELAKREEEISPSALSDT
jgi:hypothetical protein